jgi:EAL and modified HD-GYP domain-containing signal transduction protein
LLGVALRDADTQQIEQVLKQHPDLAGSLMRLVNSGAGGADHGISSVSQAIMVLGRARLQRWLRLLPYTLQSGAAYPSPLLILAATRGRMMELLAAKQPRNAVDYGDEAFMAGSLSLIDSLIGRPLADIVGEFNPGERLAAALLRREGKLGALLQLVESVEHPDPSRTLSLLAQSDGLSLSDLTAAELDAMSWANQIAEATARPLPEPGP